MRFDFLIKILLVAVLFSAIGSVAAMAAGESEAPTIEWQKLLGGSGYDNGFFVQQTADGGYILLGSSSLSPSEDFDCVVMKLDGMGTLQWEKLLGGDGDDYGDSVQQTTDGGYILLGSSTSSASGNVTGTNHGGMDFWVVKLDGAGAIQWQKLLGGSGYDNGSSVQQTADGGYILLGTSTSSASGDVTGTNHGWDGDFWVVKLDGDGMIQWQNLLGGDSVDGARSVQQTADGGYILLGYAYSSASGNITGINNGEHDFWVVKVNGAGTIEWERLLGGTAEEYGDSVQQTADGGYILLGTSTSSASGDVTGTNHGYGLDDIWVVKLDGTGTIQWEELLGGNQIDDGRSIQRTLDGGCVLVGTTSSSQNGDVTGTNHGFGDFWVVKLDGAGTIQWQKLLGGRGTDVGRSVQQTADGGYVLFGSSSSSASGDVTGTNQGELDFWVVKLHAEASGVSLVPGGTGVPTDTNADELYDDVNGNGRADFADVVLYFNQMSWIAANEPVSLFDYNGNGRIDFADVVWLFNNL